MYSANPMPHHLRVKNILFLSRSGIKNIYYRRVLYVISVTITFQVRLKKNVRTTLFHELKILECGSILYCVEITLERNGTWCILL